MAFLGKNVNCELSHCPRQTLVPQRIAAQGGSCCASALARHRSYHVAALAAGARSR